MANVSIYAIAIILCLQTLITCLTSTIGQYIYGFYLETYPNSSNKTSNYTKITIYNSFYFFNEINNETNTCLQNGSSPNKDAQAWAQQHSANLFFWTNLISSCPVIIMTYILGVYTPKLGKRFVLIIPLLGTIIQLTIWLLVIYFHLSEIWWYIAAFIVGLSGSSGLFGLTLNLIITENTLENERSSRFVRLGAMQTALSAIATVSIGYYIAWRGFIGLYWSGLFLQILSIIIVMIYFKTVDTNVDERIPLLSSINDQFQETSSNNCSHFLKVCTVFKLNQQSKKKTTSLYLILFSNIFFVLAVVSLSPFLWFLLNAPFCWTSKNIGNYSALGAISSAILSLLGMQLLTYIGTSDAIICVISNMCFCLTSLWNAFARYGWQLYVGLLINAFSSYQSPLTISMMSKWLEFHERNNAFTFITEINTIISTFGSSFFNWLYARTVVNHRNLILFIAAGLGVIPCILNICLFLITRKMSDEELLSLPQSDTEPASCHLDNNILSDAGNPSCLIISSRSLTSSLRTSSMERSRTNSVDDNQLEEMINSSVNDLVRIHTHRFYIMNNISNYAIAIILCLQTACNCVILTVGQYIYAYYLQIYPSSSNTTQSLTKILIPSFHHMKSVSTVLKQCLDNTTDNSSNSSAQIWAQEQSADLFFRINLWNSCPMIIMTYILGLYTPKLGRQFVLILPMLGTAGQLLIWLAIIHLHLADYWWYIASFIVGLSGSTYVFNFVLNLIITDNTKEDNRSSRFVLFEALITTVSAIVTFAIGYYINWRGFTDLYWISLGLEIVSIVIVIFFFKSSSHIIDERTCLLSSSIQNNNNNNNNDIQITESRSLRTKCKDFFIILQIFSFKNRSYRKSISLLLILFAYIFYLLAYSTYASFLWYLLDSPFCWSSENVGNYMALSSISCAIFSLLGMKLFTYMGVNDTIICMFSHLCFTTSSLWIAFAKHNWQLYAGLLISPYGDYQNPLTISMISKLLEVHERNHAFTFVAEITTIITTFGDSIFNWIYAQTVVNFRNFTLLMAAGFSIIAFILNICLFCVTRRMSNEDQVSIFESEPCLLPNNNNNNNIVHSNDIICSSVLYSTFLPKTPNKNRSRVNLESSTDNKMITTDDHLIL
ncbi:unnamed protein product [Rotaria sordida]|uniref:Uncharacterized protein n=1 Tax=Rotaria sordida TaxID=392033 RepID=A0A814GQ97_9BILA|nr:unnamed protein product [Rotaria sordida]